MNHRRVLILLAACVLANCDTSQSAIEYEGEKHQDLNSHVSIAYLKSLYERAPVVIDSEIFISGRVVSSDQYGAFYKTIVIEDQTGGIAIKVDKEYYYRIYHPPDILEVACNSLIISNYGGELQLTGKSGAHISSALLPSVIVRSRSDGDAAPLALDIDRISPLHVNRWVCFDDVQFEETGTWYHPDDRYLVDRAGRRLRVHTTQHAYFAAAPLPTQSGYIEGVLGIFDGEYQLKVWSNIYAVMERERF